MGGIRSFDIFKAQHKFHIGQTVKRSGKKEYENYYGSRYGAFLTLICIIVLVSYLTLLLV